MTPAKAQRGQVRKRCHFDRREKSFSDPSRSLGATGSARHLCALAPLREILRMLFSRLSSFAFAQDKLCGQSS